MKQHVRLLNQIQVWLQKFFLEYLECYDDWDPISERMLLKEAQPPQEILKIDVVGINQVWRDAKVCGMKKRDTEHDRSSKRADEKHEEQYTNQQVH